MKETIKHKLVILAIILTTLPFIFAVKHPETWVLDGANFTSYALYFSAVFGYIGVSMLVWELILGTRAITGLYFADLPSKLKLHRWLGTYGVLFALLHPFLVMLAYGEKLTYIFIPSLSSEFATHVSLGRLAFFGLVVIWATSAIIRSKIAYRPWKYIHYLAYPTLGASLLHVPEVGSSFGGAYIQFFWRIFVVVTLVCFALRMRHLFGFGKYQYKITDMKNVTDAIWMMRLQPTEKPVLVQTGQYVYIQPSLLSEEHPFTVLDHDSETGELTIAFKVFGRFTKALAQKSLGDQILVDGPYGVFTSEVRVHPEMPTVFIAGGIGVTPFVKHCIDAGSSERYMFYANQTKSSGAFRELLAQLLGDKYIDVIAKDDQPASLNDERGFLREEILVKYLHNPKRYHFFICGPGPMMNAAKSILESLGVPKNQVHTEEFNF